VENISEIIYEVNEDNVITYINPAVSSLFGYEPSEIIGRESLKDITLYEDIPVALKAVRSAISGGDEV